MAANPFAKAAAGAAKPGSPKSAKQKDIITFSDAELSEAVDQFILYHKQEKQAESMKQAAQAKFKPQVIREYCAKFADASVKPDSLKVAGKSDETVLFIVQDRGGDESKFISDEQFELMVNLIGEDKVAQVVNQYLKFTFDPEILQIPGVEDAIGAAVGGVIAKLVEDNVLTTAQSESLLQAKNVRSVKKGTLAKLAAVCDCNVDLMLQVFDALGTSVSAYFK